MTIESKNFSVRIREGEETSELIINPKKQDDIVSRLVMNALRERRDELRGYETRLEFGQHGRRRKESERRYLRLGWKPIVDRLSWEIGILSGKVDGSIELIKDLQGNVVGVKLHQNNTLSKEF